MQLSLTENVEALFNCSNDAMEKAARLGLEFVSAAFLNDSADYMDAFADIIPSKSGIGGFVLFYNRSKILCLFCKFAL